MRLTVFTDIGRSRPITRFGQQGARQRVAPEVTFVLEGGLTTWYGEGRNTEQLAEHMTSIGGLQVKGRARCLVEISLDVDRQAARSGILRASGTISAAIANVAIKVKVTLPTGRTRYAQLRTIEGGGFAYNASTFGHLIMNGEYTLQALITGDDVVGDTESEAVKVEVTVPIVTIV